MKKVVSALLIMLMLIQTVSFAATDKIYTEDSTKVLVDKLGMLGIFEQFDDEMFFKDDAGIKRSEAADVISRMLGMEDSGTGSSAEIKFFDVPQYSKYINAVSYVTGLGIMSGNGAGLFLPDDTMEIAHVLKALVVTLGYDWKAKVYGGYPQGYLKVASELKLTDAFTKGVYETATRADFLKLVDAALDIPICTTKAVKGDDVQIEIDENVNLLSEYHNVYSKKGVVQNNKRMSITSVADGGEEDVVYIGGKKLYVNGVIDVYSYLGYQVEYYYKNDKKTETNQLLLVVPTDNNNVTYILKDDFKDFANGIISYYNENGKLKEMELSGSAVVLYNGERTTDVAAKINSFEGTMTTIDNNDDNLVDVVIVKNLEYDKVKLVKGAENKLNLSSNILNLNSYDNVNIVLAQTGEEIGLLDIVDGDVIGYAESADKTKLMIDVLGTGSALTIATTKESQNAFTVDNGSTYNTSLLSADHKGLIKPQKTVSVVLLDGYYAVWAGAASETVSMGYLIEIGLEDGLFGETKLLGARILDVSGDINSYEAADDKKMIVNGKSVKATALKGELKAIKDTYKLGGDGEVSQVISYKLNDDGALTHIYTVSNDPESTLYVKYNYKDKGEAQLISAEYNTTTRFKSEGRATAFPDNEYYSSSYYISKSHPIFEVPLDGQETKGKESYAVKTFTKGLYEGNQKLDSYVGSKRGIIPKALVNFVGATTPIDLYKDGTLLLVDNTYQNLNSEGNVEYVINGFVDGTSVSYVVDSAEVSAADVESLVTGASTAQGVNKAADTTNPEVSGFTTGDIAVVELNRLKKIIDIDKVYDREKDYLNPAAASNVVWWHTYNLSEDGYAMECFEEDLTQGVPGEEKMILENLYSRAASKITSKVFAFYDDSKEKVYAGDVKEIVDWYQDSKKYTRVFVRHNGSGYIGENSVVFYNYNK